MHIKIDEIICVNIYAFTYMQKYINMCDACA